MLSKKTQYAKTTYKPNKPDAPDAVVNPELETETKLADGSLYSGITDTVYNLSSNLSGWLFGGNKSSEDKENDTKEH